METGVQLDSVQDWLSRHAMWLATLHSSPLCMATERAWKAHTRAGLPVEMFAEGSPRLWCFLNHTP